MRPRLPLPVRLLIVLGAVIGFLVPELSAPARTIAVPETLARTLQVPARGRMIFAFQPTHIAFSWSGEEGSGVRFRTFDASGGATGWSKVPENHDAENGNRHYSGVLTVDRPAAVEWEATNGATSTLIDYLNTVDGPERVVRVPALARAAGEEPPIVTRAEWGADESLKSTSGGCRRGFYPVQQLFVHHTAGSNFDDDPSATMRAIYWYHVVRQGWCDVGYNFVISWDGRIFEGRWARRYASWETHTSENAEGEAVVGAHTGGYNSGSVGVSLMGNFMSVSPSSAMQTALVDLLAWEVDHHGLRARGKHTYRNPSDGTSRELPFIAGHRDAGSTACPGTKLYGSLPQIRRDVETVVGEGRQLTSLELAASAGRVEYGDSVDFTGRLTDEAGTPLGLQTITLHRREGNGDWVVAGTVTTGLDGTFTTSATPQARYLLQAAYAGNDQYWRAVSPLAAVKVKARITLDADGSRDAEGTYHYAAGTPTARFTGSVSPSHDGKRVTVKVFRIESDGSETLRSRKTVRINGFGDYNSSFKLTQNSAGRTFVAIARFRSDGDHASAASEPLNFVVDA